jgi:transketolase
MRSNGFNQEEYVECIAFCATMRRWLLEQSLASNVGHIGSCLSVVEIMSVLWCRILRVPGSSDPDRDRFLLCKGHAALALYCAMRSKGLIDAQTFATYCGNGSDLCGHPVHRLAGVELSTGSLGQGLSVGCGIAYGLMLAKSPGRVFALLSDAECNEGQVWEAAMFAAHHGLSNLCVVVDLNQSQCLGKTADILRINLEQIWEAFGWHVIKVDGHDVRDLLMSFQDEAVGQPKVVIAQTVLGKGVEFMENRFEWHYRNLDPSLAREALDNLEKAGI